MLWSGCKQDMLQNSNQLGNSSIRLYDLYSFGMFFILVFPPVFSSKSFFFMRDFFSLGMLATCPNKFCFHLAHPSLFVLLYLQSDAVYVLFLSLCPTASSGSVLMFVYLLFVSVYLARCIAL